MAVLGIEGVIGMDVRNAISFRDGHGKKAKRARGVGMDYVQTVNYFKCSVIVRHPRPHSRVKREAERRKPVDSRFNFMPIGIVWSKDMHLVSCPGQFPLHNPDHGDDTAGIGNVSVGEKTDFHQDHTASAYIISFEFILSNSIMIV